ncbi:hypothetical protein AQUCO_02700416v1 [Aquilegia coerulea]|uniref:Uncharacterized protein n=1 Tax=Aquilegia coerulea TaxID=218851 RepID=A0A2G5D6S1_AQUCA|nr:hypothetical protein AQUCO_02700416v1 [Aquilegia coerulea]
MMSRTYVIKQPATATLVRSISSSFIFHAVQSIWNSPLQRRLISYIGELRFYTLPNGKIPKQEPGKI